MQKVKVPVEEAKSSLIVKGSKFIGSLFPVKSKEEAESILEKVRKKYYDATHNCFAYRIYPDIERFSDDGEPSGSAGKPILTVIKGESLFNVLIVITRYFGGTKLGVGGLVKAYGECAKEAVLNAKTVYLEHIKTIKLTVNFNQVNIVYHLAKREGIKITKEEYSNDGVCFTIRLKADMLEEIKRDLQEKLSKIPDMEETEEKLDTL